MLASLKINLGDIFPPVDGFPFFQERPNASLVFSEPSMLLSFVLNLPNYYRRMNLSSCGKSTYITF
ncbi:hypothetical protein AWH62_07990 [Maricaulis sp. W15]|nr:hypothetical protein AWH62_07990 [Maricaulis sp. W15]